MIKHNFNRRQFMKSIGLSAFAYSLAGCVNSVENNSGKIPNIIYILADDLGYGDLGCYGQKIIKTPHIDRMAKEGMLFTQHYSGSTVCAPSRCSLMTGLHTGHTFIRGNKEMKPEGQYPIPPNTLTVAKTLKNAGYTTGAMGKWGLGGPDSTGHPNRQGFDYWFGYLCQSLAHNYYPEHLWRNHNKIILDKNLGGKNGTYANDLITTKALDFITKNSSRPFFLFLPYTIPHAELYVPQDSMEPYMDLPEKGIYGKLNNPYLQNGKYNAQAKPHAAFAGMISRMDSDVGKIFALLKELGIDDNTLVMFTSDNGPHIEGGADPEFFNSSGPLRGNKRDLYEGGIRVPMIARWPGKIKADSKCDHISAFWDILPTFAELAKTDVPANIDGISFVPALTGKNQKQHKHLYWEFHEQGCKQAIRMGDFKAIRLNVRTDPDYPIELYNLKNDLGEKNNIADIHPEMVKKFMELFKSSRTDSEVFPMKV